MKLKANEANFRILGIETSCDETAAAVVKNGTDILSNIIASSENLHIKTGGIVPEVAAREQIKCILPVIDAALKQAFSQGSSNQTSTVHGGGPCKGPPPSPWNQIDAVAVTTHPGLIGSLVVGVETAKTLSYILKKPLVPVNHLVAHLYANWLNNKDPHSEGPELTNFSLLPRDNMLNSSFSEGSKCLPPFPSLGLIISGGHTELVLMKAHGNIKWLGGTRDDAAGEAFDKTAKMLNLGYPGGPAIERAANAGDPEAFDLPRPMLKEDNLEFSFSGLKTSLYYRLKKHPELLETPKTVSDLAASFQEAVVDVLVEKTVKAAQKYQVQSIILGGGVAANTRLREQLTKRAEASLFIPPLSLCTDNGAIIAACAYYNYQPVNAFEVTAMPRSPCHTNLPISVNFT